MLVGYTNPHDKPRGLVTLEKFSLLEVCIMPTGSDEYNLPKVFNEGVNGIRDSIPEHMRQAMFREYYDEKEVEDTHIVYVPVSLPIPLGLDTVD